MDGITIAVLNYGGVTSLKKHANSIFSQSVLRWGIPYEILIIENKSTELSEQQVRVFCEYHKGRGTRFLLADNKHQFITGLNTAFEKARYDNILFMENDLELDEDTVEIMLHDLNEFPNSIIQPTFFQEKSTKILHAGCDLVFPIYGISRKKYKSMYTQVFATTSFMMKRKTFQDIGRFDTNLAPAYYEDIDYSLRAYDKAHSLIVSTAIMEHDANYSFSRVYTKNEISEICHKNRLYLIDKHFNGFQRKIRRFCENINYGAFRIHRKPSFGNY